MMTPESTKLYSRWNKPREYPREARRCLQNRGWKNVDGLELYLPADPCSGPPRGIL